MHYFRSTLALQPPRAHVVATGELDAFAALQLRRRLEKAIDAGCVRFTVDAAGVTFVDAGGLGTLVWLTNTVATCGGRLDIVAASRNLRWVASLARLDVVFGLAPLRDGCGQLAELAT